MRTAAVGHQCVECVKAGQASMRRVRTVFGGEVGSRPYATYTLMVLTFVAYVVEVARPRLVDRFAGLGEGFVYEGRVYGLDPRLYEVDGLPDGMSPGLPDQLVGLMHGEWYRLFSPAFLHQLPDQGPFGPAHILLNLLGLWFLGRKLEEQLGWWRLTALYLLSAAGGSLLAALISPDTMAVGASGALFGLAGAAFVMGRRVGFEVDQIFITYVVWMVVSASFTSWQGHLGGLATGMALGLAFAHAPRERQSLIQAAACAATLATILGLVLLNS
ncbi:rhomboid family intramembrane serine protease [Actinocorallia lasiicapitis]